MKADGRFVKDVKHPHELGTDLGGQPDPLALASGKGSGGPVEGQVVKPHVEHETDPLVEFLENIPGNVVLPLGKFPGKGCEPFLQIRHLHRSDFRDGLAIDPETLRILVETGAMADGTFYLIVDVIHDSRE